MSKWDYDNDQDNQILFRREDPNDVWGFWLNEDMETVTLSKSVLVDVMRRAGYSLEEK